MQGTIPYLGTFLTDLTMLDTALPDLVEVRFYNQRYDEQEDLRCHQKYKVQSCCYIKRINTSRPIRMQNGAGHGMVTPSVCVSYRAA